MSPRPRFLAVLLAAALVPLPCLAAQEGAGSGPSGAAVDATETGEEAREDAMNEAEGEGIYAPAATPGPAIGSPQPSLLVSGRAWTDLWAAFPFAEATGLTAAGYSGATGLRLNLANAKRDALSFDASLDAGLFYGQAAGAQRNAIASALSGLPPGTQAALGIGGNDAAGFSIEITKLSLGLDLGPASLVIGRQIYNTGRALAFSPADLFSSPDLSGLQAGRKGMDLGRISAALGGRTGLSAIAKPGIDPRRGDYSIRASSGFPGFEAAIQGARRMGAQEGAGSWILAADLQADLILGLYGEVALFLFDSDPAAIRASAGAEYSFMRELFLRAEYYYNGLSDREEGAPQAADPLSAFPGEHYLYAGLRWIVGEDWALGAFWYGELNGHTGSGTASLSYLAAQNAQLAAFLKMGYSNSVEAHSGNAAIGARMELRY